MNVRLFNDNGCETPTAVATEWIQKVSEALRPVVNEAVKANISLRDLTILVVEEITLLGAENRLRKGTAEYKAKQNATKFLS